MLVMVPFIAAVVAVQAAAAFWRSAAFAQSGEAASAAVWSVQAVIFSASLAYGFRNVAVAWVAFVAFGVCAAVFFFLGFLSIVMALPPGSAVLSQQKG